MAGAKAAVRVTSNFRANLERIGEFWAERQATQVYIRLLAKLELIAYKNLAQHPRIGRRFVVRDEGAKALKTRVSELIARHGEAELREYLLGDYLLLYLVAIPVISDDSGTTVFLLSIRHHRQASFRIEGARQ